MGNLVFPTLPGLMYGRIKRPEWNTKVQKSVSGKEFRSAWMSAPLYTFSLPYEFLRSNATFSELQQLAAFFNNVRGSFDSFLYSDPADNAVTAQQFGTGNGTQTAFQLVRNYGGNAEAVGNPFLGGATPELVTNGTFAVDTAGWTAGTEATLSVVSGRMRITRNSTASGTLWSTYAACSISGFTVGKRYRLSLDVVLGTPASMVIVALGGNLVYTWVTPSTGASFTFTATASTLSLIIYGGTAYSGMALNECVDVDNISIKEIDAPFVFLNGTFQTSGYSISSTGLVTFTAAPANAAVLTWAGSYYYRCRFTQDTLELSEIMSNLWEAKKVEFIGSLSPNRI